MGFQSELSKSAGAEKIMRRPFSCCLQALLVLSAVSVAQNASQAQNPAAAPSETTSILAPAPAPALDPQEPAVAIRQTVRRVLVDVTVRDSNGKPVHGLAAGDFSITEDKQPQRVLSFDAYDLDTPSLARKPNAPALPPNVFENVPASPEHGPLYVMLFDMVNMENEDEMSARAQVLKFIKSKPAGTRFCIFVTTDKLRRCRDSPTTKISSTTYWMASIPARMFPGCFSMLATTDTATRPRCWIC